MADNTRINAVGAAPGDLIRTIDSGGSKMQVVVQGGITSSLNTTTTNLDVGGTYSGTFEQNELPDVMVSCKADAPGTLFFDFSVDGTNVDTFPSAGFAVASGIHEFHNAVKGPRYFRARYVNGTSSQSSFRLYTYYGAQRQGNAPLNQAYALDADSTVVRTTMPWLDLARGKVTGMAFVKKFGRNPAIGTGFAPVCQGGVYQTPQTAAATTLRIAAGGNAADTAAGTGARNVILEGLDSNWAITTSTVVTAGTGASAASSGTYTRLFRAYVGASGNYATQVTPSHVGNITIENGAGGTTWGVIDASNFPKGQTEIGAYSIPTGYTAYVFPKSVTVDTSKSTDVIFFWRARADDAAAPYSAMRAQDVVVGLKANFAFPRSDAPLGPYVGPADIGFMAKVDSTTASVAVEFDIFLVNE